MIKNSRQKHVILYTDGACSGNPGAGGWAVLLLYNGHEKELVGGAPQTTNNQMELTAIIKGLSALKESCDVELYTDSKYVLEGATKWMPAWKNNQWRKADKKAVLNKELWQQLDHAMNRHHIVWHWVKGHAGHPQNERVDTLACNMRDSFSALVKK